MTGKQPQKDRPEHVHHLGGSVGSMVANHRDGGGISVTTT